MPNVILPIRSRVEIRTQGPSPSKGCCEAQLIRDLEMHSKLQGTDQTGGAPALFTGVCAEPVPQGATVSLNRGGTARAAEHVELQRTKQSPAREKA